MSNLDLESNQSPSIFPHPARKAACWMQNSTKHCAAFRASLEIVDGITAGVSQWNRACIVAANRSVCPLDLDSIPIGVYVQQNILRFSLGYQQELMSGR